LPSARKPFYKEDLRLRALRRPKFVNDQVEIGAVFADELGSVD
jgi:hypothetical protein